MSLARDLDRQRGIEDGAMEFDRLMEVLKDPKVDLGMTQILRDSVLVQEYEQFGNTYRHYRTRIRIVRPKLFENSEVLYEYLSVYSGKPKFQVADTREYLNG